MSGSLIFTVHLRIFLKWFWSKTSVYKQVRAQHVDLPNLNAFFFHFSEETKQKHCVAVSQFSRTYKLLHAQSCPSMFDRDYQSNQQSVTVLLKNLLFIKREFKKAVSQVPTGFCEVFLAVKWANRFFCCSVFTVFSTRPAALHRHCSIFSAERLKHRLCVVFLSGFKSVKRRL